MAALQLQLEKIEEEELHQSEKQEEQEEQEEEEEEEEEKEEKEKNDRNEKKKDIENGTKSRNHMKSHLVARVELPPIDKTLEAGRKTMTKLCSSLLHAAMAVDADTPTPTPSTTPKSLTTVTATSSINQEKKKKTSEEEEEKQEVVVEIAAGSMSPSTQELLCAEYIDKENEEELEEVKPTQNSLAKSHGLGSSAVQERAILQEFSVWIRNIATNE
jgi:hypothetical protein